MNQLRLIVVATVMMTVCGRHASAQFAWDGDCGFNWYDCCNYGTEQNPEFRNNWTIAPNTTTCPNFPGINDDVFASTTVLLQQSYPTSVNSLSVTGTFLLRSSLDIETSLSITGTPTEPTSFLIQNGNADSVHMHNADASITISPFATLEFQFDGQVVGSAGSLLHNDGLIWKSIGGEDNGWGEVLSALNIPWENDGTIKATDGRLVFFQNSVNNGIIEALGEAEIRFQGPAVIDGEVRGDGLIRFVYSQATVTGNYHPTNTLIAGGGANVNFDVDTSVENLTLGNSSVISGTGDLTIDDLVWNGGYSTFAPGGTTIVQDTMLIQHDAFAGGYFAINREMELHGDSVIQGGATVYIDEGELRNYGELQLLGASSLLQPCCVPDALIQNFGTWRKSSGAPSVINVEFFNLGEVTVETGTLEFGKMINDAAITVNTGATLVMAHPQQTNLTLGSITGAGTVAFYNDQWNPPVVDDIDGEYDVGATTISGAQVEFHNAAATGTLNLTGGQLLGDDDFLITNQLNWSAGEMTGTGTTFVHGPMTLPYIGYWVNLNRTLELNVDSPIGPQPPTSTLAINPQGTLRCRDVTIDGHVNNGGVISPGTPTAPVGHLHLTGGYMQTTNGALTLNRLGPVHDHLQVDGVATLGGTLNASGYPTGGGQTFTLLTAASVQGTFAQINVPSGAQVMYTATSVMLQMPGTPCPADVSPLPDGDDSVNVNDLLAVITSWGACPVPCPPRCAADIAPIPAGDCAVNVNDLLAVITSWGACP